MQKGRLVTGDRWNGAFTLRQKRTDGEANELSGKVVSGPEEWRGNHRGAHTHGSAYTGNCWDTRVKSVSRFMVLADIPQKAHTKAAYVQLLFFFSLSLSGTVGKGLSNHCVVSLTKQHLGAFSLNRQACSAVLCRWHLRTCTPACRKTLLKDTDPQHARTSLRAGVLNEG